MTVVLIRTERCENETQTEWGARHVKTPAGTAVMQLQAYEQQRLLETTRSFHTGFRRCVALPAP